MVASRVGGIQDQIVDGETGLLLDDPHDLAAFGRAVAALLADPERARRMGEAGRQRVIERYLAVYRLREYVDLVASLVRRSRREAALGGGDQAARPVDGVDVDRDRVDPGANEQLRVLGVDRRRLAADRGLQAELARPAAAARRCTR